MAGTGLIEALVPVEHLVCPFLGRLRPQWLSSEPSGTQVTVRVRQDPGKLPELWQERRPMEGAKTSEFQERPVEHRDIGVALKDLGVAPYQVVVEVRQQVSGVVAADSGENDGDLGVRERHMQILCPLLRRYLLSGHRLPSVGHDLDVEAMRFEVRTPPLRSMLDPEDPSPARGDDGDRTPPRNARSNHQIHANESSWAASWRQASREKMRSRANPPRFLADSSLWAV